MSDCGIDFTMDHPSEDNNIADDTPDLNIMNPIEAELLICRPDSSAVTNLNAPHDQDSNAVLTNYVHPNGVGCSSTKSPDIVLNDNSVTTNFPCLVPICNSGTGHSNSVPTRGSRMFNPSFVVKVFKEYLGISLDINKVIRAYNGNPETSVQQCNSYAPQEQNELGLLNLREWFESMGPSAGKPMRLRMFRQVVQLLDGAHGQGIKLLDMRPSSFILTEKGWNVLYVGRVRRHNDEPSSLANPDTAATDNNNGECPEKGVPGDHEGTMVIKDEKRPSRDELEKEWYGFPVGYENRDLGSFNIYCLGVLLFELLCHFESTEEHDAAMVDLQQRILPPQFVSGNPEEARLCLWLLHPEPASRPTIREILQFETLFAPEPEVDEDTCNERIVESDLLHYFLTLLEEFKKQKALRLKESIQTLDIDILCIEAIRDAANGTKLPEASNTNAFRDKLLDNIGKLEPAYFSLRSQGLSLARKPSIGRPDRGILKDRDSWSKGGRMRPDSEAEERVWACFEGICKFARHSSFEVCGGLRHDDMMNSANAITSMSLDHEEELVATAGTSKKIKIFEVDLLLKDDVDVQYPIVEFSSESKFSCVCWNTYIRNYLVTADYGGAVQTWDAITGQGLRRYVEHHKIARSVDFSTVDPTRFASGSDDCSVRLWNTNQRNSTGVIWNPANVCCVQLSGYASHLLALGSGDHKIYCYDIRNMKIPWCTVEGHKESVSYVMFLDSESIVSAATDNTLKLWDLNKTSLEGSSTDACVLTFGGHKNEKNFVGLTVLDQYIACGSETNEVYAYHKSLPMPFITHKFESMDSMDDIEHYVSSVCWGKKSEMLFAANSRGKMNILRMV